MSLGGRSRSQRVPGRKPRGTTPVDIVDPEHAAVLEEFEGHAPGAWSAWSLSQVSRGGKSISRDAFDNMYSAWPPLLLIVVWGGVVYGLISIPFAQSREEFATRGAVMIINVVLAVAQTVAFRRVDVKARRSLRRDRSRRGHG